MLNPKEERQRRSYHPVLVSVEMAADLVGVSPRTIWRYINSGKLRASVMGEHTRILWADLMVFCDALPQWQPGQSRRGRPRKDRSAEVSLGGQLPPSPSSTRETGPQQDLSRTSNTLNSEGTMKSHPPSNKLQEHAVGSTSFASTVESTFTTATAQRNPQIWAALRDSSRKPLKPRKPKQAVLTPGKACRQRRSHRQHSPAHSTASSDDSGGSSGDGEPGVALLSSQKGVL